MAKRSWVTFSLRTLALILTVACVWLALKVNRAAKQRAVVQKIIELGGELSYAHELNESLVRVVLGYHVSTSLQRKAAATRLQQLGEVDYASRNQTHPSGVGVGGAVFEWLDVIRLNLMISVG